MSWNVNMTCNSGNIRTFTQVIESSFAMNYNQNPFSSFIASKILLYKIQLRKYIYKKLKKEGSLVLFQKKILEYVKYKIYNC